LRYRRHDATVFLYAFDLIELNGDDLRRDPLEVRKVTLACCELHSQKHAQLKVGAFEPPRHRGQYCPRGAPCGHPARGLLSRLAAVAQSPRHARRARDQGLRLKVMPMSVLGQIYQARDVISGREMIQMQQSVCRRQTYSIT